MEAIVQTHLSAPSNVSPMLHKENVKTYSLAFLEGVGVNIWLEMEKICLGVCSFIDRGQPEAVAQMETCVI